MNRSPMAPRTAPLQAHTGLQRGGPIARGEGPQRGGRLPRRRTQARRRDRGEERDWLTVVRPQLWVLCGGRCDCCWEALDPEWWDAHHRQAQSAGGPDAIYNAVALKPGHHTVAAQSVHMRPQWAKDRGLIVPPWDDPETVPLWLPNDSRVILTAEGKRIPMPVLL